MTTKRKTAAERDAATRARIRERLIDIIHAAHGDYILDDPDGDMWPGVMGALGPDGFGRYLGAIKRRLLDEKDHWCIGFNSFETWDNLDKAVERILERWKARKQEGGQG